MTLKIDSGLESILFITEKNVRDLPRFCRFSGLGWHTRVETSNMKVSKIWAFISDFENDIQEVSQPDETSETMDPESCP